MVEATQSKTNARAVAVSSQRQKELADGLEHEETSVLTPTTDTMALKLANGQVIRMRNFGVTDATVIGVNKIWPGGANAGSLNGGGITTPPSGSFIGQFEQFIPFLDHVEFSSPSRVTDVDGVNAFDTHATSVAGVMIAEGLTPAAKGIAYNAEIKAHSWWNPHGTILGQAAEDSRASNHSYGAVFGWDSSAVTIPVPGQPSITRQVNYFIGDIFANRTESPYFGLYNSQARVADETACLQPYQLITASAGNDRGQNEFAGYKSIHIGGNPYFIAQAGQIALGIQEDVLFNGTDYWHFSQGTLSVINPYLANEQFVFTPTAGQSATPLSGKPGADGGSLGFDTIPLGQQVAKNVLTVGAVTSASGLWFQAQSPTVVGKGTVFGPTDDGRIKPDVMANGVNVNTPKLDYIGGLPQDNLYETTATGTSFSSASVTGGASLLSELQERALNFGPKEPLRAATLKGLVIHTATDMSTTGPDYRSGWGIAQIDKAAALIQANYNSAARTLVKEVVLPDTKEVAFTVRAAGSQQIKVTASWADPVAQPDPLTGLLPDQQAWTESSPGSGTYVEPANSVLNNNLDVRIHPITDNTTNPPTLGAAIMPWKLNPASPASAATRGHPRPERRGQRGAGADPDLARGGHTLPGNHLTEVGNVVDRRGRRWQRRCPTLVHHRDRGLDTDRELHDHRKQFLVLRRQCDGHAHLELPRRRLLHHRKLHQSHDLDARFRNLQHDCREDNRPIQPAAGQSVQVLPGEESFAESIQPSLMRSINRPRHPSAGLGSLKHAAVLCGMLLGFQAAQAAVIYYKPPQRLALHNFNASHHDYSIDLNDDGVVDLQHDASGGSAYLRPLEETRFLGLELPNQHVTWYSSQPYALAAGTTIDPDSPSQFPEYGLLSGWHAHPAGVPGVASLHVRYDAGTSGFFVGTSGYIGVEFLIDGQVHYGWIHLGNYTWWQSEIHGWAYESEPGKPILAGAIPEPSVTGAAAVALVSLLLRRRRLHGPFDHPR